MRTGRIEASSTTTAIIVVGLVDLLTSVYWLATGQMREGNPIMSLVLGHGVLPFIFTKICTLILYVTVMSWYERQRPRRARVLGIATLCLYLAMYFMTFLRM
jgi:hypothetical protein